VSRVFTIADIFQDPHFHTRDMLIDVPHPTLGSTRQVGIVPKMSKTPGNVRWSGPDAGADTATILERELGYSPAEVEAMAARGVIGLSGWLRG
jgi:crotonobetainyl-CoA:carnitine CoA-transferase CaiB-like acyl-CoA transferase